MSESRCGRGIFAVNTALIAGHHQSMLLIGAGGDLSQPAPLSLDALGVPNDRALECHHAKH